MREDKSNTQLYWAAGAILGLIVAALFGFSIGEKGLHKWQELIAGLIGAAFTLIGAAMIVAQIKADDEREERKDRRRVYELSQTIVIEIERILSVLADQEVDAHNIVALSKNAMPPNHFGDITTPEEDEPAWRLIRERNLNQPDLSRLQVHINSAGLLGLVAGEAVIHFYEQTKKLKFLTATITAAPEIPPGYEIWFAGHAGEKALRLANAIIEAKGDVSRISEIDPKESFMASAAAWKKRTNSAWDTWHLIRALGNHTF